MNNKIFANNIEQPQDHAKAACQQWGEDNYTLKFPYKLAGGGMLTTVSLRRLTVKDIKLARRHSNDPNDWDEILIARMTCQLPEDIDAMDLVDYQVLQGRFRELAGLDERAENANTGTGDACEMVSLATQ